MKTTARILALAALVPVLILTVQWGLSVHQGTVYAQNPSPLYSRQGMPVQFSTLPEGGRLGDVIFLTTGTAGLYVCTTASCGSAGGWVCSSCGGGGFTAAGDLSGSPTSQTVAKIQTHTFDISGLANNVFLYYDTASTTYKFRVLQAADIPNHSASLLTSGTVNESLLPSTINGDKTFTGNVSANSLTSSGAGESFLELKSNVTCTQPPSSGLFHLCSQVGTIGIFPFGGSFTAIELLSNKNIASGYAGLNGSAFVPAANLGAGSTVSTNCLHGDNSWSPCGGGGGGTFSTVTFAATPTFDLNTAAIFKITLTGNVTSSTLANLPAAPSSLEVAVIVCQDGTGSRTFVWPANVKGGMTIGAQASTCSAQQFQTDGTNAYAVTPGVVNQ